MEIDPFVGPAIAIIISSDPESGPVPFARVKLLGERAEPPPRDPILEEEDRRGVELVEHHALHLAVFWNRGPTRRLSIPHHHQPVGEQGALDDLQLHVPGLPFCILDQVRLEFA